MTRLIQLEIEADADPIRGTIRAEPGASVEFHGWVGLAAALERLLESVPIGSPREREGADANR